MTRACGECSAPCKKYGEPRRYGVFVDQIVTCTKCNWCGVETEIIEHEEFIQLDMFDDVDFTGLPDTERGDSRSQQRGGGEQADAADIADAVETV